MAFKETNNATIQLHRGTAAAWTANNPVLASGEPGYETDTHKLKIGDGTTAWNNLSYFVVIPAAPAENGSYYLKCLVSGGVATYSWVSAL